jgi:hypothetical protein
MTYSSRPLIGFADTPIIDSFGRVRVANPVMLLEAKRIGAVPDIFMTNEIIGNGSVTYNVNRASTTLALSGPGVSRRQTKARAVYQAGKGLEILQTFCIHNPDAGGVSRIGYFDNHDGAFFISTPNDIGFVIRSSVSGSPIESIFPQSQWNIDRLDGSGPSGIILKRDKAQILYMDAEYLGVGRVRFGFVINGQLIECHQSRNANEEMASVYMSNPNLPLRWEIEGDGGSSLEAICGQVSAEGGYEVSGITSSAFRDAQLTINTGVISELISIRIRDEFRRYSTAFIDSISSASPAASGAAFGWRLVQNPTVVSPGAWTPSTGSIMEINRSRVITPGTGILIASGFTSRGDSSVSVKAKPVLTLGQSLNGDADTLSLQIESISGNNAFVGSLTWREVY